jgi:hypothetical protein
MLSASPSVYGLREVRDEQAACLLANLVAFGSGGASRRAGVPLSGWRRVDQSAGVRNLKICR